MASVSGFGLFTRHQLWKAFVTALCIDRRAEAPNTMSPSMCAGNTPSKRCDGNATACPTVNGGGPLNTRCSSSRLLMAYLFFSACRNGSIVCQEPVLRFFCRQTCRSEL